MNKLHCSASHWTSGLYHPPVFFSPMSISFGVNSFCAKTWFVKFSSLSWRFPQLLCKQWHRPHQQFDALTVKIRVNEGVRLYKTKLLKIQLVLQRSAASVKWMYCQIKRKKKSAEIWTQTPFLISALHSVLRMHSSCWEQPFISSPHFFF